MNRPTYRRLMTLGAAIALGAVSLMAQIASPASVAAFEQRAKQLGKMWPKELFNRKLTEQQRQGLQVLYAYMPLPDVTDYAPDFYLDNVNMALKARAEMPWGKTVPDREFRHFVLPVRINNEALDRHRQAFYDELKPRVQGLSMYDAILEINHWCHEKVTYQPSDGRTHSPLMSVYSAIGRCGEESTFTVAALRTMGIPARQVYTPRWAHTDDNHAWVEAWADGQWYFLGACEPEAMLNLGWFNAPAARGMMMHTRVLGNYDGPEEVIERGPTYTDINVTSNYAPTATATVRVLDTDGKPVKDAKVRFSLYNYAEFYPLAVRNTDAKGQASLNTGLGDMVVWASKGDRYGFAKYSTGKDGVVDIRLLPAQHAAVRQHMDIIPPVARDASVVPSAEAAALNQRRFVREDSIRHAYTATFMTPEQSVALARELNVDAEALSTIMTDARGNHAVLEQFLRETPAADRARAMRLLGYLLMKDRSDVPLDILRDHMTAAPVADLNLEPYILDPRVIRESLTPYRQYFSKNIPAALQAKAKANPEEWVKWVGANISTDQAWLPANLRMNPVSVWQRRVTDPVSRDIFFVAAARSMGIPAQVDPVTEKPQWADAKGQWHDAVFAAKAAATPAAAKQGSLQLVYKQQGHIDNPKYYSHFTVSKLVDGQPRLLNYPEEATWSELFQQPAKLDAGEYLIVSGQRLANGGVLTAVRTVTVKPDQLTVDTLELRNDAGEVQVIGNFNAENIYHDLGLNADKSLISTTGRGYYVLGLINPAHEPSNHALRDIAAVADKLEQNGAKIMLMFADQNAASRHNLPASVVLPNTTVFGIDPNGTMAAELKQNLKLGSDERPVFVVADTFNRIVFVSQGYTIGLGQTLLDILSRVK